MSAAERENLKRHLEALRATNPVMPPELERRIREQIAAEAQRPTRVRRPPFPPAAGGMSSQLVILLVLVMVAGWLVSRSVLPVLRANATTTMGAGEVDHCAPSEPTPPVPAGAKVSRPKASLSLKASPLEHCERLMPATAAPSASPAIPSGPTAVTAQ